MCNVEDLKVLTVTESPDVICISETWLESEYPDQLLDLNGYIIFREDRSDGNDAHGGVLIAVKKKNHLNPMSISIETNHEVCFINCNVSGTKLTS